MICDINKITVENYLENNYSRKQYDKLCEFREILKEHILLNHRENHCDDKRLRIYLYELKLRAPNSLYSQTLFRTTDGDVMFSFYLKSVNSFTTVVRFAGLVEPELSISEATKKFREQIKRYGAFRLLYERTQILI